MLLEMAQSWLKLAEQTAEGVATEVGCEAAMPDSPQSG
jgi:hypothetical protein